MPKHKFGDKKTKSVSSSSEDSDDEHFTSLACEAVDPILHKSLYEKSETSEKKLQEQGKDILPIQYCRNCGSLLYEIC